MKRLLRRKLVVIPVLLALVVAGAGLAAWIAFSGSGEAGARSAASSAQTLTIAPAATGDTCTPSASCSVAFTITNSSFNDGAVTAVTKTGPASVVGKPGCDIDSHVTFNGASAVGAAFSNGNTTVTMSNSLAVDGTVPICAANSDWRIPITVTGS